MRQQRIAIVAMALALTLGLAACSPGGTSSTAVSPDTTGTTGQAVDTSQAQVSESSTADNGSESQDSSPELSSREKEDDSSSSVDEIDISTHVVLKMYAIGGDPGPQAEEILAAQNAYMTEKINASLEPAIISWADWETKYPAVLASGERFDMIYASEWAFLKTEAPRGAYLALDDLLPIYAPESLRDIPQIAWDQSRVNGQIYAFPAFREAYSTHLVVLRGDLRKKYGVPEITRMDDLGVYFEAIKQNEPDMVPYAGVPTHYMFYYEHDWGRPMTSDNGEIAYTLDDPGTFFVIAKTPEYKAMIERNREWYLKGYWPKNAISMPTAADEEFANGKSAATIMNLWGTNNAHRLAKAMGLESWDIEAFSIEGDTKVERSTYISDGTAIYRNAPNPERALMFLNLVHQDEDFYFLIHHGIRGVSYELTEDGKLTRPEGVDPSQLGGYPISMGLGDSRFDRPRVDDWDFIDRLKEQYRETAIDNPNTAIQFDREPVSAEIAAINNVCIQYKNPLEAGMVDPEEGLATLIEQLEKAGIQKVIDAFTEQRKQQGG